MAVFAVVDQTTCLANALQDLQEFIVKEVSKEIYLSIRPFIYPSIYSPTHPSIYSLIHPYSSMQSLHCFHFLMQTFSMSTFVL